MMISDEDITDMENDVMDTIMDWHCTATIFVPKPIDQQTNWNERLHEFNGDILYNKYIDVPVERVDGYFDKQIVDVAGDISGGSVILYIPIRYKYDDVMVDIPISDNDIRISMDGDTWRIKSFKKLLGEYLVNVNRMVGDQ
jgi:hypothetical protein